MSLYGIVFLERIYKIFTLFIFILSNYIKILIDIFIIRLHTLIVKRVTKSSHTKKQDGKNVKFFVLNLHLIKHGQLEFY